jgi:DNA-binding MarR family transcriptional regulator
MKRRADWEEEPIGRVRVQKARATEVHRLDWAEVGFELWRAGIRWRRAMDGALAQLGISYTEFLVLRSTFELCRKLEDAVVSQTEVAIHSSVSEMLTSRAMRRLETRGLVDRGPSAFGFALRVIVTRRPRSARRVVATYPLTGALTLIDRSVY